MKGEVIKFPDRLDTPFSPRAEPATVIILPVIKNNVVEAVTSYRCGKLPRRGQRIKSTPEQVELRRQDRLRKLDEKKTLYAEASVHAAVVYLSKIELEPAAVVAHVLDGKVPSEFIANQIDVELDLALAWLQAFAVSWRAQRGVSSLEPFTGPSPA